MKFVKIDDELTHFGVVGMHWGHHKSDPSGPSKSTDRMAKKDAKRHADAKMFYGQTAGTKRKLLKAELEKKKRTIPGYEEAFNKHLENVDFAKSAKKAVRKRHTIDATHGAKSATKQILGITGSLTVAAGTTLYYRNKPQVDAFVARQAANIYSMIRNGGL
jgi:hypothetical protein